LVGAAAVVAVEKVLRQQSAVAVAVVLVGLYPLEISTWLILGTRLQLP
jgi:hypothetical protein